MCIAEKGVWESFTELRLEKMSRCYPVREVRGKIFQAEGTIHGKEKYTGKAGSGWR